MIKLIKKMSTFFMKSQKRPFTDYLIRTILTTIVVISGFNGFAQTSSVQTIPDGLYLIIKTDTTNLKMDALASNEMQIYFSKLFEDYNSEDNFSIIIDTTEYVPLVLDKAPMTEQQTEAKKKLLLSLTPEASEKLKSFTTKHVMKHVVLVVAGEALTMHKIKEPITSGQLQITRCNDNACEQLNLSLNDNIKKMKK